MFAWEFSPSTTYLMVVVQLQPRVEIGPKFIKCLIDLFAKRYPIELIEQRLVKTLTNPIGLETLGLGPGAVDIFCRQVQLISWSSVPQ
jgi:hypothetical protein